MAASLNSALQDLTVTDENVNTTNKAQAVQASTAEIVKPTVLAAANSTLKYAGNEADKDEPLLAENPGRFVMFPIEYPDVWEMYKKHMASFWTAEEIDFCQDRKDWATLNDNEQHFVKMVLAFFAASDGIVLENLASRFMNDVQIPEVRAFYGFQLMMENIHSETYSLLIDTYIQDQKEKTRLFNAIESIPCIQIKSEWALRWISDESSFAERLLAFACVEGIYIHIPLHTHIHTHTYLHTSSTCFTVETPNLIVYLY